MKSLRIGLVVAIGILVLLGVYWRSQGISDDLNGGRPREAEERDAEVKDVLSKAEQLAQDGDLTRAASLLRQKANTLETGHQADQLRLMAIQYGVMDYVNGGGTAAPLDQLATDIVDKSSPGMEEMAYIVAGDIYTFTGKYDQGQRVLNQYLQQYPPLTKEEIQEYRRIRQKSSATADEGKPETPPRTLHRDSARRMLDKMKMVGQIAPDFKLTSLDGSSVSPSDYRGKTLLLHFWASWSKPARQRAGDVKSAYDAYHQEGLEILGLSLDRDRETLVDFVDDSGIQWKQVLLNGAERQKIIATYGVDSIPTSFLIGPRGRVRAYGRSLLGDGLERNLRAILEVSEQ